MLKPICYKCHRFYRMQKSGLVFIEGKPDHPDAKPGTEDEDRWSDYKLWSGDLWQCKGCGHQLISGVAYVPISEHYKPEFEWTKQRLQASYRVNDC